MSRQCSNCHQVLSAWEPDPCGCIGPRDRTNREVLYAIACTLPLPVHTTDLARLAETEHHHQIAKQTATTTLAQDPRMCWAGQGTYGLLRHGPFPGPRKIADAARICLIAAAHPLSRDGLYYCLRARKYRMARLSLEQALNRSPDIRRLEDGRYDHPRGEAAERQLRGAVHVVPPRQRALWEAWRDDLASNLEHLLQRRSATIQRAASLRSSYGFTWSDT